MSNFSELVSNILIEQGPGAPSATETPINTTQTNTPTQQVIGDGNKLFQDLYNSNNSSLKQLKDVYEKKFGVTIQPNQLFQELNKVIPSGKYNVAAKYVTDTFIPFIDAFVLAVDQMTKDPQANKKPTMAEILQNVTDAPELYNPIFAQVAKSVSDLPLGSRPLNYQPSHPNVIAAWRTLNSDTEKLAQTAIESLYNENIFEAVSKIIAKRINVFDAIGRLKGGRRPFSNTLIRPILLKYRNYISLGEPGKKINWEKALIPLYGNWIKKVSGDFKDLVDDVSADNLIRIAIYAGEYYLSLLRKVVIDNEEESQNNESLSFNDYYNFIVSEAIPHKGSFSAYQQGYDRVFPQKMTPAERANWVKQNIAKSRTANKASGYKDWEQNLKNTNTSQQVNKTPQGATPLTQVEYNDIARGLGSGEQADHSSFITTGVSRYLGKTVYNIGAISKDPSEEAKKLIGAIRDIAYHIRKGPSTKDRLDGLNKGLQSIWAMSGHKLYN
jgi:hypothetical protein